MFASLFLKRTFPIKFGQRNVMWNVIPQFLSPSKHFVKTPYYKIATKNNVHQEIRSFSLRKIYSNAYNSEEGIHVNEANELLKHLETEWNNHQRVKSSDAQMLLHFLKKGLIVDYEKYALLLLEWCGQSMPDKDASARISFAHTVWQVLRSLGPEIGTKHYNALLKCYSANNHKVSVRQFLSEMGTVQPDNITYELLLECCCIVGDLQQATETIQLMKDNNISISETTFNSLILGHARAGDIKGSLFILDSMYAANLLPSSNTYTALLLSYAEFGNIVQMKKMYQEAVTKNINLSLAQILSICRVLGLKGYHQSIAEFLEILPDDVKKFSSSVQNTMLEFIHSKNENAALSLMMTLLTKQGQVSESVCVFFVSEMCRANTESSNIINICDYFEKNQLYPRALYKAAETSLNLAKPEQAMQIFIALHKNNEILRPHYFWPLFRLRSMTNGEAGIVSTLKDMQAVGVTPDFDTLLDYIVPVLSAGNPEQAIEKLKACKISVRQSLTPVAATLLLNGRFESLLRLCENYPTKLDVEKLLQPLVEMFLGKKYAKSVVSVLNIISKHSSMDDLAGQFLIQLLTAKQTRYRQKDIVNLLQSFKEGGLFISSSTSDVLTQFFKNGESNSNHYQQNISLLEAVTHPELHTESTGAISHPRYMNLEELECHLLELKSNDMNTRGVLRRLLQIHVQEGNIKRVLEIKKELEDGGFKFSPGMQASMFAMYIRMKDVKNAEKCLSELMHQAPDFGIDEHKIIDYATLLVTENQYKAAVAVLERRTASGNISGGESISRNCWELLNALALKGEPQKVKHMLHLLKTLGFCSINNILLGPLIRVHLIQDDLEGAVREYKTCAAEFRKTPLQLELLTHIVRKEDDSPSNQKLLEEVLSVTASVHGKSNTSVPYIIALADCNKKKELENFIMENQNNIQYGNIVNGAKRLANENKLATLSILTECIYKTLPRFNVSVLYTLMLQVYDKKGDSDGALKLWTEMQERNIQPSSQFLESLALILKNHKKPIPFVYPQI